MPVPTSPQSTLLFRVKGIDKRIVYQGNYNDAARVIKELYPYHCCVQGFSKYVAFKKAGDYIITDVATDKIEHSKNQ